MSATSAFSGSIRRARSSTRSPWAAAPTRTPPWAALDDETPLPAGAWPIVSLERWQDERDILLQAGVPLGLRLRSDQSPAAVADEVDRFDLIALDFPKFTDGRSYSHARLLRERYGYRGELRAVGKVLRDQFTFLLRCGFDSLEVADESLAGAWDEATSEISHAYQRATDPRAPIWFQRHPELQNVAAAAS